MASDDSEDDGLTPTPEQIAAYQQRVQAAIGLGRFDMFLASLHGSQIEPHKTQANCIVVQQLGASMSAVEYDGKIGIAVPEIHAAWIDNFPFDFIGVTAREVFFITKSFTWLKEEVETLGVSLGTMIEGELLARMCNQSTVDFFVVESLAAPRKGRQIRQGAPVRIFQAQDAVPLFKTRDHYESIYRAANPDPQAELRSHFVG